MRALKKVVKAKVGIFDELSKEDSNLLLKAISARRKAQAPYSNYFVGVAVRSSSGIVYWGCNVERCSWTQTTHAEQNAIDSIVANEGPVRIDALALAAAPAATEDPLLALDAGEKKLNSIEQVTVPCGHCLQIIWENCYNNPDIKLIALASNGEAVVTTIGDALPMKFGPKELGVDYSKVKKDFS